MEYLGILEEAAQETNMLEETKNQVVKTNQWDMYAHFKWTT